MEKVLSCRVVSDGITDERTTHIFSGIALVSQAPVGFNFSVDVPTGTIIERGHELEGISIKDKILVFPNGKGSTGGSYVLYQIACEGTGPAAIINQSTEVIIACGAIMGGIPVVDCLDENPLKAIETGDYVEVDTEKGLVTIRKGADQ